ncbi:MAG: hypothetical protein ABW189_01505 [Rickettsiales bacterium]
MSHQHTVSFRIDDAVHRRMQSAMHALGLSASKVFRDALTEKLEELEELSKVAERIKQNRAKKPIAELWHELGLDDPV